MNQHVYDACMLEVLARKVGNVHPGADFHDMTVLSFARSAQAIAYELAHVTTVGDMILRAILATRKVIGVNTNLGIVLLLAPLVAVKTDDTCERGIVNVLTELTVDDAISTYEAIRLANPTGLADAPEHDVKELPTVTLLDAMRAAHDRDMIAHQYASNYESILTLGLTALCRGYDYHGSLEAAILNTQLAWLVHSLDSHIVRKFGLETAERVQQQAEQIAAQGGLRTVEGREAMHTFDDWLRQYRINPGTTADLVTACLYVALRDDKLSALAPFAYPDY